MKYPTIKMPNSQNVYLLSSSSDRIVQNCMNLSGLFPHKTAAFYRDRCMTHCFESHKMLEPPHSRTVTSFGTPFSHWILALSADTMIDTASLMALHINVMYLKLQSDWFTLYRVHGHRVARSLLDFSKWNLGTKLGSFLVIKQDYPLSLVQEFKLNILLS